MCKTIFGIKMYVSAHFSIKGKNKFVVRLHHTKFIGRCSGNNMEWYFYLGIQTYLLFRNCGGCVIEKPSVRIEKKTFSKSKSGMHALRAIYKYWIIPFSVCVLICTFINSRWCLISRQNKQISSQEHLFPRRFRNDVQIASQEHPFLNGCRNTQNGDLSNNKGSNGQDFQKEDIFDSVSTKEAIFDAILVENEDNLEGGGDRTIRVWSDCDGHGRFEKWVCEGNRGRFKQEPPSKP